MCFSTLTLNINFFSAKIKTYAKDKLRLRIPGACHRIEHGWKSFEMVEYLRKRLKLYPFEIFLFQWNAVHVLRVRFISYMFNIKSLHEIHALWKSFFSHFCYQQWVGIPLVYNGKLLYAPLFYWFYYYKNHHIHHKYTYNLIFEWSDFVWDLTK